MPPPVPASFGVPWTPEEAAAYLAPRADADLLRDLVMRLGVPESEPGKWDAADLLALHFAVAPWLRRRLRT
jgi:hypothetical protein